MAYRSKRAQFISRLEGFGLCFAPNVGNFSRVWRVVAGLALQMWGIFLAFGGLFVSYCSKRG